ncbi:MAG: hypothetical protein FWH29_05510 [Methanobrevibacter sp.]|nr:hypothetical protein [Methanobrevibacter sp.]
MNNLLKLFFFSFFLISIVVSSLGVAFAHDDSNDPNHVHNYPSVVTTEDTMNPESDVDSKNSDDGYAEGSAGKSNNPVNSNNLNNPNSVDNISSSNTTENQRENSTDENLSSEDSEISLNTILIIVIIIIGIIGLCIVLLKKGMFKL